jgi:hypothetical protein
MPSLADVIRRMEPMLWKMLVACLKKKYQWQDQANFSANEAKL